MCGLIKKGGGGRLVVAGKERNDARMYNTCYIGENVSDFSSARVGRGGEKYGTGKKAKSKKQREGGKKSLCVYRCLFAWLFLYLYFSVFLYSYLGHYPFLINTKHPPGCRK